FNLALLGRWRWNLFQHQGELWARVLESKYGGWRSMEAMTRGCNEFLWWQDLKLVLHQSQQGNAFQNGIVWKVGCGDRIRFWEDSWIADEAPLIAKYHRLYLISSQQNQLIQQMGTYTDTGWEWNFIWRRPLFDSEIYMAANFRRDIVG
ncbi:hypothetical protein glysoja_042386, partial [Glycine soja]